MQTAASALKRGADQPPVMGPLGGGGEEESKLMQETQTRTCEVVQPLTRDRSRISSVGAGTGVGVGLRRRRGMGR